jgi:hypothetical protein
MEDAQAVFEKDYTSENG